MTPSYLTQKAIELVNREYKYYQHKPVSVVFDHISKCAGTSVASHLKMYYPYRKTFTIEGDAPAQSVRSFNELSDRKRKSYTLVHGHLARGLFSNVAEGRKIVTVLRDPIARLISHYYYVLSNEKHALYKRVKESKIQLADYSISDLSPELQNWYVSYFSDLTGKEVSNDPEGAIEVAFQELLQRYDLIGFQESLSSFLEQLNILLHLPKHASTTPHKNLTLNKPAHKSIDSETLKRLKDANHLDIQLFERLLNYSENGLISK